MDFDGLSYDEIDEQVMELLIFADEEISVILRGHLVVEQVLEKLLSQNMESPKAFFKQNRSYELKLDLAKALGLLDQKHYAAFKALNKVRNQYSHDHNYKVSIEELSSFKFDWEDIQNKAFVRASIDGSGQAAIQATLYLCWKAVLLVKSPED